MTPRVEVEALPRGGWRVRVKVGGRAPFVEDADTMEALREALQRAARARGIEAARIHARERRAASQAARGLLP